MDAKAGIAATAVALLLAGCATPFSSHPYDGKQATTQGFVYHLTSGKATATFRVGLRSCDSTPVFDVLDPAVTSRPIADRQYRFRIDPTESVNVLKAVEEAVIVLTDDGRLASASSKTQDQLADIVAAVAKTAMTFAAAAATPSARADAVPTQCTDDAAARLSRLRGLRESREKLHENLAKALREPHGRYTATIHRAYVESLELVDKQIDEASASLVKVVEVELAPKARESGSEARAVLDACAAWVKPDAGAKLGCKCRFSFHAQMQRPSDVRQPDDPSTLSAQAGIYYRVPVVVPVTASVSQCEKSVAHDNAALRWKRKPQAVAPEPIEIDSVPVPQWGPVMTLRGDFGAFSDGNVKYEFDSWGVPKQVTWSGKNGGVAALLGVTQQIASSKPPPADPNLALQAALRRQVLERCLAEPSAQMTAPCSELIK